MVARKTLLVVLISVVSRIVPAVQADWPNFRGPKHDGISLEKGFKTEWKGKVPILWERNVGSAFSSFACVGDAIYTCGTSQKEQTLIRLNGGSGAVVWQKPFEKEYREDAGGDGTRATPTVDDGRVYVLSARGLLLCVDAATGDEIWHKQFNHVPRWGYSGSVLVEGDLAIASAGDQDGSLIAFDKRTGQERWKCGNDPVGYATPYPFTLEGERYVLGFMGNSAMIAEILTGRVVLRKEWITDYEVNAASPVFHEGHLFLGSGYETGSGLLKLRKTGDGLAADTLWQNKVLMPKFQSPILHEGSLYCSDQKAFVCMEFLSGKELWRKPRMANGTLLLADGHLILLTEKGKLQIGKPNPASFTPTTDVEVLSGRCWTVPVLHQGKLLVRDLDRVVCLDLAAKGKP